MLRLAPNAFVSMTHLPPGLESVHRRSGRRSPIRDRPAIGIPAPGSWGLAPSWRLPVGDRIDQAPCRNAIWLCINRLTILNAIQKLRFVSSLTRAPWRPRLQVNGNSRAFKGSGWEGGRGDSDTEWTQNPTAIARNSLSP